MNGKIRREHYCSVGSNYNGPAVTLALVGVVKLRLKNLKGSNK